MLFVPAALWVSASAKVDAYVLSASISLDITLARQEATHALGWAADDILQLKGFTPSCLYSSIYITGLGSKVTYSKYILGWGTTTYPYFESDAVVFYTEPAAWTCLANTTINLGQRNWKPPPPLCLTNTQLIESQGNISSDSQASSVVNAGLPAVSLGRYLTAYYPRTLCQWTMPQLQTGQKVSAPCTISSTQ